MFIILNQLRNYTQNPNNDGSFMPFMFKVPKVLRMCSHIQQLICPGLRTQAGFDHPSLLIIQDIRCQVLGRALLNESKVIYV